MLAIELQDTNSEQSAERIANLRAGVEGSSAEGHLAAWIEQGDEKDC